MSNSLKDQLLALGLAKKPPPRRKPGKRKAGKQASKAQISLQEAFRQKARTEKREVKDKRRQKRADQLERQRINKQIQPIVDEHKKNNPKAELKRNFMYKGRIRSVLVTPEQLKALNAGELSLVFLRGSYFILEPEFVAQVRAISEDHVPDLCGSGDEDDEEHPVPDDLVW